MTTQPSKGPGYSQKFNLSAAADALRSGLLYSLTCYTLPMAVARVADLDVSPVLRVVLPAVLAGCVALDIWKAGRAGGRSSGPGAPNP